MFEMLKLNVCAVSVIKPASAGCIQKGCKNMFSAACKQSVTCVSVDLCVRLSHVICMIKGVFVIEPDPTSAFSASALKISYSHIIFTFI